MSRSRWCLLGMTALTPLSVQVHTNGDSVATVTTSRGTRFEVLTGVGEYSFVTRGCEGQILSERPVSFREVGGAIERDLGTSGLSLGARGGWMRDDLSSAPPRTDAYGYVLEPSSDRIVVENRYVNPYLAFAGQRGSVGVGWVLHREDFITAGEGARNQRDHPLNNISGHVRIGSERRYFAIRWMEGTPLYSSGGFLTLGAGGHPNGGPWALYGGVGAGGPFEGAGVMFQTGYQFPNGLTAHARSRFGGSGKRLGAGIAVGVGYGGIRP